MHVITPLIVPSSTRSSLVEPPTPPEGWDTLTRAEKIHLNDTWFRLMGWDTPSRRSYEGAELVVPDSYGQHACAALCESAAQWLYSDPDTGDGVGYYGVDRATLEEFAAHDTSEDPEDTFGYWDRWQDMERNLVYAVGFFRWHINMDRDIWLLCTDLMGPAAFKGFHMDPEEHGWHFDEEVGEWVEWVELERRP